MNPEFARNLWLQATPRRTLGLLVILAVVFAATALKTHDDLQGMLAAFFIIGVAVCLGCGAVWGSLAAGGSVLDEIRDRTWDFQRLSALTPWRMTWGKLAGAGALAGLGAGLGLLVAVAAVIINHGYLGQVAIGDGYFGLALTLAAGLAALVVLAPACAMGAALVGVRKARIEGRIATSGAVLVGLIAGLLLLNLLSSQLPQLRTAAGGGLQDLVSHDMLSFWGMTLSQAQFVAASLAVFAVWAVVGAWRLMRLELQMRNGPWVWVGFLVFAGLWRAGLAAPESGASGALLTAAAIIAVLAYAAAFVEPADPLRLRRFASEMRGLRLWRAADLAPAWVFALKLSLICGLIAALLPASSASDAPAPATIIAALSFLIRDLGVIAICRFGPRPGRGDLSAVVALALLYGVGAIVDLVIAGQGVALFSPLSPTSPVITLISGVVQASAAWTIAVRRIGAGARA